jgi:uncharacterized C2H2 Zn-finger protein
MTLRCPECDGAVRVVADNGVTDPANGDRWEQLECQRCGYTFSQVLHA